LLQAHTALTYFAVISELKSVVTIVLVHGSWLGGWCWRRVAPLLRSAGHDVFAPTLTGLGDRSHLGGPNVDLSLHVQDIRSVLEIEELQDVILVGHSYAGMVITAVADQVPDRIAQLVYLDAIVPEHGLAIFDLIPPATVAQIRRAAEQGGAGLRFPPAPAQRSASPTKPISNGWLANPSQCRLVPTRRRSG
jgi:pimeloyl-ACP methyl ester carboxylesterase